MIKYSLMVTGGKSSTDGERKNKEEPCKVALNMKEITTETLKK